MWVLLSPLEGRIRSCSKQSDPPSPLVTMDGLQVSLPAGWPHACLTAATQCGCLPVTQGPCVNSRGKKKRRGEGNQKVTLLQTWTCGLSCSSPSGTVSQPWIWRRAVRCPSLSWRWVGGGSSTCKIRLFSSDSSLPFLFCCLISYLNSFSITWARSEEDEVKIFEILSELNVRNAFVLWSLLHFILCFRKYVCTQSDNTYPQHFLCF